MSHCGLGPVNRIVRAWRAASEFAARYAGRRLKARTGRTITDTRELTTHLAEVRNHGYVVDQHELEPHLCCVAGPVFDRTGTVVASISVSGPDSRIDDTTIPAIADAVCRTA